MGNRSRTKCSAEPRPRGAISTRSRRADNPAFSRKRRANVSCCLSSHRITHCTVRLIVPTPGQCARKFSGHPPLSSRPAPSPASRLNSLAPAESRDQRRGSRSTLGGASKAPLGPHWHHMHRPTRSAMAESPPARCSCPARPETGCIPVPQQTEPGNTGPKIGLRKN